MDDKLDRLLTLTEENNRILKSIEAHINMYENPKYEGSRQLLINMLANMLINR